VTNISVSEGRFLSETCYMRKKKCFSVRRVAQEQLKRDSICESSYASYLQVNRSRNVQRNRSYRQTIFVFRQIVTSFPAIIALFVTFRYVTNCRSGYGCALRHVARKKCSNWIYRGRPVKHLAVHVTIAFCAPALS